MVQIHQSKEKGTKLKPYLDMIYCKIIVLVKSLGEFHKEHSESFEEGLCLSFWGEMGKLCSAMILK